MRCSFFFSARFAFPESRPIVPDMSIDNSPLNPAYLGAAEGGRVVLALCVAMFPAKWLWPLAILVLPNRPSAVGCSI